MMGKALSLTSIVLAYAATAVAHEGENYHMMDGLHGTIGGAGHWGGGFFMLLLWALVVLAIIYLIQKILQNHRAGGNQ